MSEAVSFNVTIPKQQPGLWVYIDSVEVIYPNQQHKDRWSASFDTQVAIPGGNGRNVIPGQPDPFEISPGLRGGRVGRFYIGWIGSFPDTEGPTIRLHMSTDSHNAEAGPQHQKVNVKFTMDVSTSSWPSWGEPSKYNLTFQFEGRATQYQFSFGNSSVSGSRDIQLGLMLSPENQVAITCQQVADGTLDFIDVLTGAVLAVDVAQGLWAIDTVAGTEAMIKCLSKGADKVIGSEPDPPDHVPTAADIEANTWSRMASGADNDM